LSALAKLLPTLLRIGFAQFVLPAMLAQAGEWLAPILYEMGQVTPRRRHRVLSDAMLLGQTSAPWTLCPSRCTVVIYPQEATPADALYRHVKRIYTDTPLVQVVPRHLYLGSEHGRFLERVTGRHEMLEPFIGKLQNRLETL
jgi:hypothetical protein